MRCACIDIGSNTTRLLVAEPGETGGLRTVATARALNRLGAGRAADGSLDPRRVAGAAEDVAAQVAAARDAGAERIVVVATAAVRGAPDAEALARRLGGDVPVLVLTGDEEARLAFAGALAVAPGSAEDVVAVVDVGGASTEIVVGARGSGALWVASLPLGSSVLTETELTSDPPTGAQLDRARASAAAALAAVDPPPARTALAVGGSATSLAQVLGGGDLSRPALGRALDALCCEPADVLAARHGLHPDRVRMLAAGLVILDAAAERLGVGLQLAAAGLREGIILGMLDEEI